MLTDSIPVFDMSPVEQNLRTGIDVAVGRARELHLNYDRVVIVLLEAADELCRAAAVNGVDMSAVTKLMATPTPTSENDVLDQSQT